MPRWQAPPEEGERPVVGVEHHLLRLARIGPHIEHPAMAKPHVRDLHRHRHAGQHHDLVAPVELISLARREAQRHISRRRHRRPLALPAPRIAAHRVVAALIAQRPQLLEHPDQRQPLARAPCARSPSAAASSWAVQAPASAAAAPRARRQTPSPPTAAPCAPCCATRRDRGTISLIDLPLTKNSRRIRAIVSTTSIPAAPLKSTER